MPKLRPWKGGVVVLLAMLAAPAFTQAQEAMAEAALLSAIPDNATAFVAVRNLKELDGRISAFSAKLGFPMGGEDGMFPSALEWLKEQVTIDQGLNESGSLGIVVQDCSGLQSVGEIGSRVVVMIPVSDIDALADSLGARKENDIYKLELMGEEAVGAMKDGFLILGETDEALRPILTSKKGIASALNDNRRQAFGKHDVFAWMNFQGVSPEVRKEIEQALQGLMMMGGMANPAATEANMAGTLAQFNRFVTEAAILSIGLDIDPVKGVAASMYLSVKPDSSLGQQMKATVVPVEPLMIGLPDESVIMAVGTVANTQGPGGEEEIKKALDQVMTEDLFGNELTAEQIEQLKSGIMKCVVPLKAASVSFAGLPAEGGQGMLGLTVVATVDNAKKYQASIREFAAFVKQLALSIAKEDQLKADEIEAIEKALIIKESAEQISGATADHIMVDLKQIPDMGEEDYAQVIKVVGDEGILFRITAVDATHVAITFGGGKERCESILTNVAEKKAPLAQNKFVKMVADRLPTNQRLSEGYLHLENILTLVISISNHLEQPFPFPLMIQETAPLSMTNVRLSDNEQQTDLLIPMELAMTVKEAVQPILGMMMGGMMGGPPMEMEPEPLEDEGELN